MSWSAPKKSTAPWLDAATKNQLVGAYLALISFGMSLRGVMKYCPVRVIYSFIDHLRVSA